MLLKLKQDISQKDIEVTITYPLMNKTVERLVSLVKSADMHIECYGADYTKMINISDIYYIESVDKTVVVFCEKEKYRTKHRLFQLNKMLEGKGFVQISKYCILNLNKLDAVNPIFNRRMEAILSNGKRLYVNRKYITDIKQKLRESQS